jgi:S-adenosylmethionine hydrolase
MPILTLTTDWGLRDHYLASFKGELISLIPNLHMIDISHEIEKFNTMQAAFIIQNCFQKFPKGTIHFIGVAGNENCSAENPFIIVRTNGQYLFGEDNGIFTLILGNCEKEIVRLPLVMHTDRNEMHLALLETIKKLAEGTDLYELGNSQTTLEESYFAQPTVDSNTIRGTIIYIDGFGNAIVNIKQELFIQEKRKRNFIIHFRKSTYNVSDISLCYEDVEVGEIIALFNKDGFLEISLNKESAGKLLGLKLMDPIRIEFDDSQVS